VFTTETAGLPEMASPGVLLLHGGDRLDLRIGPGTREPAAGYPLRRDPDETWAPIPVRGIFAHQLRFPDGGFY